MESAATQPGVGDPQTSVHGAGGGGGERQRILQHLQVRKPLQLYLKKSLFPNICGVSGYSTYCQATGLSSLTSYRYRIRASVDSKHGPWSQPLEITTTSQYCILLHELSVCLCVGVLQDNLRLQSICTGQSIGEMLNSHNQSLRQSIQSFKPNSTSYCCSFSSSLSLLVPNM